MSLAKRAREISQEIIEKQHLPPTASKLQNLVTTERQIAANRRNGEKSTGPKSRAGKQRTRNNAYRHGFAAARGPANSAEIEELALMFAEGAVDPITMEQARVAAHAHIELTL